VVLGDCEAEGGMVYMREDDFELEGAGMGWLGEECMRTEGGRGWSGEARREDAGELGGDSSHLRDVGGRGEYLWLGGDARVE
jgi:hypothetical protein